MWYNGGTIMIKQTILKETALKYRKLGLSYGEIRKKIGVSKSTLSLWLKNVPLSPKHKKHLYTKQIKILARGSQSQKERRKRDIEKIIESAGHEINIPISDDTMKLFGAALYWAEGSKTNEFSITNSDPVLILFFVRWVEKILKIKPTALRAKLNIYPQQNEIRIKKFWSELTTIPIKNFTKSFVKPLSKNYRQNILYHGTIRVIVPKGTDLRHRLFGWIHATLQDIEPRVKFVEKKWVSLKRYKRPVNI